MMDERECSRGLYSRWGCARGGASAVKRGEGANGRRAKKETAQTVCQGIASLLNNAFTYKKHR
jgi:hypothetical protein